MKEGDTRKLEVDGVINWLLGLHCVDPTFISDLESAMLNGVSPGLVMLKINGLSEPAIIKRELKRIVDDSKKKHPPL